MYVAAFGACLVITPEGKQIDAVLRWSIAHVSIPLLGVKGYNKNEKLGELSIPD